MRSPAAPAMPDLDVREARVREEASPGPNAAEEVWRDGEGRPVAWSLASGRGFAIVVPGYGVFDCPTEDEPVSLRLFGEPKVVPAEIFRRLVLPLCLQLRGYGLLHASGVSIDGRVWIFSASSGTGKSTLAAGMAHRGFPVWADDAVLFRCHDGNPWTWTLGGSLRLDGESRRLAAEMGSKRIRWSGGDPSPGEDGARDESGESSLPLGAPIGGIVLLTRDTTTVPAVGLDPVPASEGIREVLHNSWSVGMSSSDRRRRLVEQVLGLLDAAPLWRLRIGSGAAALRAAIDTFVDHSRSGMKGRKGKRAKG